MKYILLTLSIVVLSIQGFFAIRANYLFEKQYLNHWNLADKSSTIEAKQKHINNFVKSLEEGNTRGQFAEYNAIYLQTPDNSFVNNLEAVKTLNSRLQEISKMSPSSFEYNTAIQQITAQEQGEAANMINNFRQCYKLANYPIIWCWIGEIIIICFVLTGVISGIIVLIELENKYSFLG